MKYKNFTYIVIEHEYSDSLGTYHTCDFIVDGSDKKYLVEWDSHEELIAVFEEILKNPAILEEYEI